MLKGITGLGLKGKKEKDKEKEKRMKEKDNDEHWSKSAGYAASSVNPKISKQTGSHSTTEISLPEGIEEVSLTLCFLDLSQTRTLEP